jgi:hypothetical protein
MIPTAANAFSCKFSFKLPVIIFSILFLNFLFVQKSREHYSVNGYLRQWFFTHTIPYLNDWFMEREIPAREGKKPEKKVKEKEEKRREGDEMKKEKKKRDKRGEELSREERLEYKVFDEEFSIEKTVREVFIELSIFSLCTFILNLKHFCLV